MTIAFIGDSLLDTGNLDALLDFFGIDPFPAPLYSEGKASNGLVLSEAIAAELGVAPDAITLGFQFIPDFDTNPLTQPVNYAVAGATTGPFGSEGNDLQFVPVGLQTQVAVFLVDLIAAGAFWTPADQRPDVFLSAGSNDVFEVLVDLEAFAAILFSPQITDDELLQQALVSQIVGNVERAIATLDGLVDDIVIAGIPKLGDTPFAIQIDSAVDALLSGDFAGATRNFLTDTAAAINAQLSLQYDGKVPASSPVLSGFQEAGEALVDSLVTGGAEPFSVAPWFNGGQDWLLNPEAGVDPVEQVMVIDGISAVETGLANWAAALPADASPITDLSYRDYVMQLGSGNPQGLPTDLSVSQFAFIDGVHGTEALNLEIAKLVAAEITSEFPDFGLG